MLLGDRAQEALTICETLLKNGTDTDYVLSLKGRCELNLKWYPQAKGVL